MTDDDIKSFQKDFRSKGMCGFYYRNEKRICITEIGHDDGIHNLDNGIEWQVSVSDNKYTVRFHTNGELSFLRHGESWDVANRDFKYSKLILCMAQELYSYKSPE